MIVGITMGYRGNDSNVPVLRTETRTSEAITSAAASTQAAATAQADEYITVATDTNIWIRFGANPTAAAGDDWFLPAGQIMSWEAAAGDKVAVIAA